MQTTLFENIKAENNSRKEISYHAESYKGLYAMHKYWGKKPFNIMADFIKKYTNEGDIVLDPFCGSGVSISEAVFNARKGLGVDINPSSILITKNVIKTFNCKRILELFSEIESAVKDEIQELYLVERDGNRYVGQNFLWEQGRITEIRYSGGSRKKHVVAPKQDDIERANELSYESILKFFPNQNFLHNSRINANRDKKISDLFTPRNLYALSLLFSEIEKIKDVDLRDFFKFCFTGSIGQASKMVFVIKRRNKSKNGEVPLQIEKKEVGSWVI
ncbi:MAG: DNA adenine methylase, partial [Lewinella sp.]|nr:DNA adenine methylase [Lewinella sp.]